MQLESAERLNKVQVMLKPVVLAKKTKSLPVIALLLAAGSALANDTSAVLTTGGLEFVNNDAVVIESEDLFIAKEEIRVVYGFCNESAEDHDILVAFHMPELVPNFYASERQPRM